MNNHHLWWLSALHVSSNWIFMPTAKYVEDTTVVCMDGVSQGYYSWFWDCVVLFLCYGIILYFSNFCWSWSYWVENHQNYNLICSKKSPEGIDHLSFPCFSLKSWHSQGQFCICILSACKFNFGAKEDLCHSMDQRLLSTEKWVSQWLVNM